VKAILVKTMGAANVIDTPAIMPSEDVGVFALPGYQIPTVYFALGAADPGELAAAQAAGKQLPGAHTSKFLPKPEPTIATGIKSMTAVAMGLLQ
jgi:hypothetical protein